jgi:NAD(P)-dependent dehydrogenase (short-subunit alcohol dehydrogenase family)
MNKRVLVVGRSPGVLVAAVELLRAKGYSADATNQFDRVLDDYDVTDLDVLVFGGMVPADTKQKLGQDISERNPHVTFLQGLIGIAGVIAAQVQAATSAETNDSDGAEVNYDAAQRSIRLTLTSSAPVTVEAWWLTSFVPPEPKSTSMPVFDGRLDAGPHVIPLPDQVPSEASFVGVTVGSSTHVFTAGPMPQALTRLVPTSATDHRLPPVRPVTTSKDDQ